MRRLGPHSTQSGQMAIPKGHSDPARPRRPIPRATESRLQIHRTASPETSLPGLSPPMSGTPSPSAVIASPASDSVRGWCRSVAASPPDGHPCSTPEPSPRPPNPSPEQSPPQHWPRSAAHRPLPNAQPALPRHPDRPLRKSEHRDLTRWPSRVGTRPPPNGHPTTNASRRVR